MIKQFADTIRFTYQRLLGTEGELRVDPQTGQAWIYHSGAEHRLINDAEVGQPARRAQRAFVQLAERNRSVTMKQCRRFRRVVSPVGQDRPDVCSGIGERHVCQH